MLNRVFHLRASAWRVLAGMMMFFVGAAVVVFIAVQIFNRDELSGSDLWFLMFLHFSTAVVSLWIVFCGGLLVYLSRKNLLIVTVTDQSALVPRISLWPFSRTEIPLEKITRIAQFQKKSVIIFWGEKPFRFRHAFRFYGSASLSLEWFRSQSEAAEFIDMISKKSDVPVKK